MVLLIDEKSSSRSGKHAMRKIPFIVYNDGKVEIIHKGKRIKIKPTYVKGYAYQVVTEIPSNAVAVQFNAVKNLRGKVKGEFLAPWVFLIPIENTWKFKRFLDYWNADYEVHLVFGVKSFLKTIDLI